MVSLTAETSPSIFLFMGQLRNEPLSKRSIARCPYHPSFPVACIKACKSDKLISRFLQSPNKLDPENVSRAPSSKSLIVGLSNLFVKQQIPLEQNSIIKGSSDLAQSGDE